MSQKREMGDMGERLQRIEDTINAVNSRLADLEERLMEMERRVLSRGGDGAGVGDTIDLSGYPVDRDR